MEEYRQQVIDEQKALVEKLEKLRDFINSDSSIFRTLSPLDQSLLCEQRDHMRAYAEVLDKRIARFQ